MTTTPFTHQLEADNAILSGEHCTFAATDTVDGENWLVPLTQYGFVRAQGPDGQTFFQGQTTADFRQVTMSQARNGAYCTPKGRMLASFTAARLASDTLLLKLRRDCTDDTLKVLGKYAVFSKVELCDASSDYVGIGVAGPSAAELLGQHYSQLPQAPLDTIVCGTDLVLYRAPLRYELWLTQDRAAELWPRLRERAQPVGSELWDALDIEAGEVSVCAATRDAFLPQLMNYDINGAVSFKKGCYTGQEVVARLHFKGVPKRRLYLAELDGAGAAGDDIFDAEKPVGTVASCVSDGSAAIVLATSAALSTDLKLKNGTRVTQVAPPPYGLPDGLGSDLTETD